MTGSNRGPDWRQVRLILSAHRTATRRRWASDGGRVLRAARDVSFAAIVPITSVGVGASLRGIASADPGLSTTHLGLSTAGLHLVYFLVFAALAFGPLLGAGRTGLPDPARLAGLPVAPRTAFAATVGGQLSSATTLGALLAGACVVLGYGGGAGWVLWRIALLALLAVCGVAVGQVLLLAFARTLTARRLRGAGALLPVVAIALALLGLRSVTTGSASLESVVLDFAAWSDWTVALPSWWAAAAATASGPIDVAPAVGLAALLWWLVGAGGLLERSGRDVSAPRSRRPSAMGRDGWLGRRLPGPLAATLAKDLRLLAREPALRTVLAPQAAFALLPAALVLWAALAAVAGDDGAAEELGRLYPLLPALGYTLVFMEATVVLNLLGLEGRGVAHWLSLPEPRGTLLVGKDLAVLLTLGSVNAVVVGGTVLAAGLGAGLGAGVGGGAVSAVVGDAALAALEALCVLAAALAVGDVVSVLRPVSLAGRGRGMDAARTAGLSGSGGLLFGALGAVLCAAAALPVALLFHHPTLLHTSSSWLALTVPLAVLGSAGLLLLGARAGGALLAQREETVRTRML